MAQPALAPLRTSRRPSRHRPAVPAVEVVVPPAVTETHSTSFVADLAQAVSRVEQTRQCT